MRGGGLAIAFAFGLYFAQAASADALRVPDGFRIQVWAEGVTNARSLAAAPQGVVFVGTRTAGLVHVVQPGVAGAAPQVRTLLRGLDVPNGVAFRRGALYVAERGRILRYDDILARLDAPPAGVEIARLPSERHHDWRYMAFGPDDRLYVAIGVPCNICDRDRDDYATIIRMKPDGSAREVVARGVRNSVGFTWHPRTRELWFTDNGRDMLGDDVPPCELNRLSRVGEHFGYPFCHGANIADPEFGSLRGCTSATPPVRELGPHVAPLGLVFYSARQFPAAYRGDVFIAEHGSWNRSEKIGYRIMRVRLRGNRALSYEPFATGWLGADGRVTGRPVDLLLQSDGSMLVSDDVAGVIHRISYEGSAASGRRREGAARPPGAEQES